jgi:hypothetical protein
MSLDRILQGLPPSEERLLPVNQLGIEMADLGAIESQEQGRSSSHGESNAQAGPASKSTSQNQERYTDHPDHETADIVVTREVSGTALVASSTPVVYRVYKRRWFGLMQLVLLNIIISWDVSIHWSHITVYQCSLSSSPTSSSTYSYCRSVLTNFVIPVVNLRTGHKYNRRIL